MTSRSCGEQLAPLLARASTLRETLDRYENVRGSGPEEPANQGAWPRSGSNYTRAAA